MDLERVSGFQRFRGDEWMPEPCSSCERKTEDLGGCRCLAFLVADDPDMGGLLAIMGHFRYRKYPA